MKAAEPSAPGCCYSYCSGHAAGHICIPIDACIKTPLDDLTTASRPAWLSSVSTISRIKKHGTRDL